MIKAGLFDGSFPKINKSMSTGYENREVSPQFIEWERDKVLPVTFYTDRYLDVALEHSDRFTKVALLLEPPSTVDTYYYKAFNMEDHFNYILTFNQDFIKNGTPDKWLYYPLGGSWIDINEWDIYNKTKLVSMFISEKRRAVGHTLRLEVYRMRELFGIDVYGHGYNPVVSKIEGLQDYCYSVVIESIRTRGYFSEKIIDCISQGTIPVYWGDPDIGLHFNMDGIITFNNTDDLTNIMVNTMTYDDYKSRLDAARENLEIARQYVCAEDWIYKQHTHIFEGNNASV